MAKIGNFINVTDIRGKLGGTVFTKSRSAHVLRVRVKGKNPRTQAQTTIRSFMTNSTRAAINLTDTEINSWKAYAEGVTKHNSVSGAAYHPTWLTAYNELSVNFKLVNASGSPPTTPPTTAYAGDTATFAVTSPGAGDIDFTTGTANATGTTTLLYVGKMLTRTRTPSTNDLRVAAPFLFSGGTLSHTIPGFVSGATYAWGYKFVDTATGQATNLVLGGTVTVA